MEATATRVQIQRSYPVARERIFEACTDPALLARWFAPTDEYTSRVDVSEMAAGQPYRIEMHHQGGNVHTMRGTIQEVSPPHRLAFTMSWEGGEMAALGESLVTIELDEAEGGTVLTLTHEGLPEQRAADEHAKGWEGCLFRLGHLFERTSLRQVSSLVALHTRLFFNVLAGVSPENRDHRFNDRTNNMRWVAGHLAHTRASIAQLLGAEDIDSPLAVFNEAINEDRTYPDWDDIENVFRKASAAIQNRLPHLNDEALSASAPFTIPSPDQSVGGTLDFLLHHEAYHIGQLGILRKALGYEAMSYGTRSPAYVGRFTWYDLMTTDPSGAIDFYSKVAGWGTAIWSGGDGEMPPYTMWTNEGSSIGGVMTLPAEVPEGTPPHWITYIGSPHLEDTIAQAEERGGRVLRAPQRIPTVGRFAVLFDPSGAVFAIFTPAGEAPGHDGTPQVGEFSWHELATTDAEKALGFYMDLFGWTPAGEFDMAEMGLGIYHMFGRGDVQLGGIFDKSAEMPGPPAWLFYIRVPDIEEAVEAVRQNGGTVINGPMPVPGGDMIAQCVDPQGAMFALHAAATP